MQQWLTGGVNVETQHIDGAAVERRGGAAGLAHEEDKGGRLPRLSLRFRGVSLADTHGEAVVPACRYGAGIQAGGSRDTEGLDLGQEAVEDAGEGFSALGRGAAVGGAEDAGAKLGLAGGADRFAVKG